MKEITNRKEAMTIGEIFKMRDRLGSCIANIINEFESKTCFKLIDLKIDRYENHYNGGDSVFKVFPSIELNTVDQGSGWPGLKREYTDFLSCPPKKDVVERG